MKVLWSANALERLDVEAQLIARRRPLAARRFVEQVRDAVARLAQFPHSGRLVPEFPGETVREVVVGSYRVIYRPESDQALVLHLMHQRQGLRREHLADDV